MTLVPFSPAHRLAGSGAVREGSNVGGKGSKNHRATAHWREALPSAVKDRLECLAGGWVILGLKEIVVGRRCFLGCGTA